MFKEMGESEELKKEQVCNKVYALHRLIRFLAEGTSAGSHPCLPCNFQHFLHIHWDFICLSLIRS
jgi:hypothetical protein